MTLASNPCPTPHDRDARRDALLVAARSVFAERGYHAATVEEIAARADIGKGTVYLLFDGGKAGLLAAVVDEHLAALRGLVVRSFAQSDGTVRYRFWTLALATASYFRQHPDLLRVHACEIPRLMADPDAGPAAARLAQLTDHLVDVVAPVLDGAPGIAASCRTAAHHLLATLFGHLISLGLQPDTQAGGIARNAAPCEIADTLTALVFDGIAARPSSETGSKR